VVAWWNPTDSGIRVTIRVSPGARKTALMQVGPDDLRIRLAARPVEGQANAELVGFVAQLFGVRRSAVHLVRGDRSRIKTLEIDGLTEPPPQIINLR
jgi:uncharacterized protein (TIGR00251 family)